MINKEAIRSWLVSKITQNTPKFILLHSLKIMNFELRQLAYTSRLHIKILHSKMYLTVSTFEIFGHPSNDQPTLLSFRDRTPKRTNRGAIKLIVSASIYIGR
jgi:hypothetical protein